MNFKECEKNNLRLLIGYLVHIFHFKNVHYININHTFKVKNYERNLTLKNRSLFISHS